MKEKNIYKHLFIAMIWIAVGVIWILSNRGLIHIGFNWNTDWPVIFILIGIGTIIKLFKSKKNPTTVKNVKVEVVSETDENTAK